MHFTFQSKLRIYNEGGSDSHIFSIRRRGGLSILSLSRFRLMIYHIQSCYFMIWELRNYFLLSSLHERVTLVTHTCYTRCTYDAHASHVRVTAISIEATKKGQESLISSMIPVPLYFINICLCYSQFISSIAACAAASLAIGTLKGEHDT